MNGMTFWVKRHMSTKLIYSWLESFYKDICWPFKRRCENMRFWNWWCYIYNRKKKVKNGIDYQDMAVTVSNHSIISSGVGKDFQKMILTSKLIKITYFQSHFFFNLKLSKLFEGHVVNYQCVIIAWKMWIPTKSVLLKHHTTLSDWRIRKITIAVLNAVSWKILETLMLSSIRIVFTKSDLIDFCLFVSTYLFPKWGTG